MLMNVFLFSPLRVYREHVAKRKQAKEPISLYFENSEMCVSRNRSGYQRDRIAFLLDTKKVLFDARIFVARISRVGDDGSLSRSLNDGSKFMLGWPQGEHSFEPHTVGSRCFVVLFHHKDGKLQLFTDSEVRELRQLKEDMPRGRYRLDLEIDTSGPDLALKQSIEVCWDGNLDNLSINIVQPDN